MQLEAGVLIDLGDRGRGRQRPTTGEYRQGAEQSLGRGAEQIMAPGHRLAQCLMPFGKVRPAPTEHSQRWTKAAQQRYRGQDTGAGRGQLDCQRQMIKPLTNPTHDLGIDPGHNRAGLTDSLDEQFGRRPGRQRRDRVHLLGSQAKR